MRYIQLITVGMLATLATWALPAFPVVFQDDLAIQNSSDVIGDPAKFDIDNLKLVGLNSNVLQVDIRFNFGGGTSLTPFAIAGFTPVLSVGDLFFRTPDTTYAYILNGHDGLSTNGLYTITGTQSSASVLGNPAGSYRPAAQVWAAASGAQLLSTGSANISTVDNTPTYLLASLYIQLNDTIVSDLDKGFNIYFAAATCGNDELTGTVPASPNGNVPELGTWAMLGSGLIGLGLIRRRA